MRRVAAIFNRNARAVTAARIDQARASLGAAATFVTGSLAEAHAAADAIIAGGYDLVCTGGGDGTFVRAVTDLAAAARAGGAEVPIVFGLRLGSGNAIADVCGAGPPTAAGIAADLARAAADEPPGVLQLLDVREEASPGPAPREPAPGVHASPCPALACSAGCGLDAAFSRDLDHVARPLARNRLLRPIFGGGVGVWTTAVVRTLPGLLRTPPPTLRITVLGPGARLGADGRVIGAIADGEVVHDGPATMVSCSTITTYGRGVIMFPHAERHPGRFQLRLAAVGAGPAMLGLARMQLGLAGLPRGIHDLALAGVRIEPVAGAPLAHVGGEVFAPRGALIVTLAPLAVRALRGPR